MQGEKSLVMEPQGQLLAVIPPRHSHLLSSALPSPAYQTSPYHHGFIPGALPIKLFVDLEVLQNFS